jgi:hypothetical protein
MGRDALKSARRQDLKGLAWHGLLAVGLAMFAAISFIWLCGVLLTGALVVEAVEVQP